MAHSVKVGDRVSFHFIPAHVCGGVDCKCAKTETVTRPGVVTRILSLCGRTECVDAADAAADCADCAELAALEPIELVVDLTDAEIALGYTREQGPQNRSRATGSAPHDSGTWTPTN